MWKPAHLEKRGLNFTGIFPQSALGRIGEKMVKENQKILDKYLAGIRAASNTEEKDIRYDMRGEIFEDEDWLFYESDEIADIYARHDTTQTEAIGDNEKPPLRVVLFYPLFLILL